MYEFEYKNARGDGILGKRILEDFK